MVIVVIIPQQARTRITRSAPFLFGITFSLVVEKGKTYVAASSVLTQKVGI